MVLAHLNHQKFQIGAIPALEHLNGATLEGQLRIFLLGCQVNNLSLRSIQDYSQKIGFFVDFCRSQGITTPAEVNTNHIRLFLVGIQQYCKPASVKAYYGSVNRFFNWLVEEGALELNPMGRMHPPRVPKQLIKPFRRQDIADLLALCDNSFLGLRNRAIILTFLDTGLRLTELAGIQFQDMDLEREIIRVMGKGAKERVVRIGKETQKAVLRYLLQRSDSLLCLWVTEERRPMKARGVQVMIRRLGQRAGLKNVRCSPHTFRHTFGTAALELGADLREVQSILGHSTLTMTLKYVATVGSEQAVKRHKQFSPVDNMK